MCMTIGPALLFIAWWGNMKNGFTKAISVYGRVAFFYYILHFFFIHLFSSIAYLMRGHTFSEGVSNPQGFANFIKPGEGVSLGMTYLIWIAIVASLYPLCKWYDNYKTIHKEKWWLSYLWTLKSPGEFVSIFRETIHFVTPEFIPAYEEISIKKRIP